MNIKTILRLLFCSFLLISSSVHASTTPPVETKIIPTGDIYKKIASLKLRDIKKITGKKLTLKQKIGFLILKKKIKHAGDEDGRQGKTAQVFGILALGLFVAGLFLPYVLLGSLIAAILAIVNGSVAMKANPNDKKAHAGKLLGWITLGLIALLLILVIALVSAWSWG